MENNFSHETEEDMAAYPVKGLTVERTSERRKAIFVDPASETVKQQMIEPSKKVFKDILNCELILDVWLTDGSVVYCDALSRVRSDEMCHIAWLKQHFVVGKFIVLGAVDDTGIATDSLYSRRYIEMSVRRWDHQVLPPRVENVTDFMYLKALLQIKRPNSGFVRKFLISSKGSSKTVRDAAIEGEVELMNVRQIQDYLNSAIEILKRNALT